MGILTFRRMRERQAAAATKAATKAAGKAHQALLDQVPPAPTDGHDLPDAFISTNAHKALQAAGVTTYEQLEPLTLEQLEAVKGIGKATAQKIQAEVATWRASIDEADAGNATPDDEKPEGNTETEE